VLSFATRTWDGWDYIPHAWPVWIDADDGVLLVGEPADPAAVDANGDGLMPGRPIAVARVARTAPGEAWLEGIRVDPRVRGMNVATDLQVAELHVAAKLGANVVRYATGQHNEGSHRLGARHGFDVLASFRTWWWSESGDEGDAEDEEDDASAFDADARAQATEKRRRLLQGLASTGLVATPDSTAGLWSRLVDDDTFQRGRGLYEYRAWALQALTSERFTEHVARGEVVTSRELGGDHRWALAIIPIQALPAEDVSLHVGLLVGDGQAAIALASQVRGMAGESIRFRLPEGDAPMSATTFEGLGAAGFQSREWLLDILGRPLDASHPPPSPDAESVLIDADGEAGQSTTTSTRIGTARSTAS
jgi:GNAT superfamily N-acetyltransferase